MTRTRTVTALLILTVVAAGVAGTIYHKYYREPVATYIETDSPQLERIRVELGRFKADLRDKGLYSCCIMNDCDWCALRMGHCNCAKLVMEKGKEKSCPECAAAWNRKRGKIPGVDPDAIEVTTFGIYGFETGGHHFHATGEENANSHEEAETSPQHADPNEADRETDGDDSHDGDHDDNAHHH